MLPCMRAPCPCPCPSRDCLSFAGAVPATPEPSTSAGTCSHWEQDNDKLPLGWRMHVQQTRRSLQRTYMGPFGETAQTVIEQQHSIADGAGSRSKCARLARMQQAGMPIAHAVEVSNNEEVAMFGAVAVQGELEIPAEWSWY